MRFLPLALPLVLLACAPAPWRQAKQQNTPDAYETFAEIHSNYPQASTAMNRAESMRWQTAKEENTASAWSAYLRQHHASGRADQARRALDDASWSEAVVADSDHALKHYLAAHPQGAHVDEAQQALERLLWRQATEADDVTGYQRYLQQLPEGPHAEEAASRMELRAFERAQGKDSVHSYRAYLNRYPKGAHASDAMERLHALSFSEIEVGVVLAGSWRPDRAGALRSLSKQVRGQVLPALTQLGFSVKGGVATHDGQPGTDGRDAFPLASGVGRLVLVVDDAQGDAFQPLGHATTMTGTLYLYSADKEGALLSYSGRGETPDVVYAADEAGLYDAAAKALTSELAGQSKQIAPWYRK